MLSYNQFSEKFSNAIETAVRNHGTKFQILLLNPEDISLVERRQDQLPGENVDISIYRNISTIQKIRQKLQNLGNMDKNFQVKLYSRNPSLAIYINDDDLFLTFF